MRERTISTRKSTYKIGMNEESCFTVQCLTGQDDEANPLWSKPWLIPSWSDDVLKMIAQWMDKNVTNR